MTASALPAGARERRLPSPWRRPALARHATVLAFMAPWLLGFLALFVYPLATSLYLSFTRYNVIEAPTFIGLGNYQHMLDDPLFWTAMGNTLWMTVIAVPCNVLFALTAALVLVRARTGAGLLRTVFYLPSAVPAAASALAFAYLLNPGTGPVNGFIQAIGLPAPPWFTDPDWAKPGLVLLSMWTSGAVTVIFLAALLDVPRELYEAADVDGWSAWAKLRHLTLPMISPALFFALVTGVIDGFQAFTAPFVISGTGSRVLGAPQSSLLMYTVYLYREGFANLHMGYACAMAIVLLVVCLACTVLVIGVSRRFVYYQGGR
jgi:multiple sugar transport system permease protein